MDIVNEYRIKSGITMADIKKEIKKKKLPWNGASTYIHKDAVHSTFKCLSNDITVNIAFPEDLTTWDSFEHVLILDEMGGQPYYPFYQADEKKEARFRFPFVLTIIGIYNKFMDSLSFLERIKK